MENIRKQSESTDERRAPISLKERLEQNEKEIADLKEKQQPEKKSIMKLPFKWKSQGDKYGKPATENKVLCDYLNKTGVWEGPMWQPIIGGELIIINNKAHKYRPSQLTFRRIGTKLIPVYVIREIDREPVCNIDWNKVKLRGDSTRNDELLLKMLLMAGIEKQKKPVNKGMMWILGLVAAGIAAYVIFA